MLTFNGTNFGPVFCAPGARGFYGEGYPFHKYWEHLGMNWSGTGFAGKTITLLPHQGNMPLKSDGVTPQELFPRCIAVGFHHNGWMLNALGLSNFGTEFYLKSGEYHKLQKPFFLSFKCLAEDKAGREAELRDFCMWLNRYLPFRAPVALQLNEGCPNLENKPEAVQEEICQRVSIAQSLLDIPIMVNTNALMPTGILQEVARVADGLWIGNTIPWRAPETLGVIDWDVYGGEESPLRARGLQMDGGLSSHQCFGFTALKVRYLRESGVKVPIVAGNGIRTQADVAWLRHCGADAVFVGSLAVVRPNRMSSVVGFAQSIFERSTPW